VLLSQNCVPVAVSLYCSVGHEPEHTLGEPVWVHTCGTDDPPVGVPPSVHPMMAPFVRGQ
jgi:hypothetical protein